MNIETVKITPVFSYFTESEKNPKKTKKSLKKVLTSKEYCCIIDELPA